MHKYIHRHVYVKKKSFFTLYSKKNFFLSELSDTCILKKKNVGLLQKKGGKLDSLPLAYFQSLTKLNNFAAQAAILCHNVKSRNLFNATHFAQCVVYESSHVHIIMCHVDILRKETHQSCDARELST